MKLTRLRWRAPALRPDRESSEGGQRLQSRLNVPQIDFGLEKRDLVIERDLVESTYQDLGLPSLLQR